MLMPHYANFAKIRREKVAQRAVIVKVKIVAQTKDIWIKFRVDSREFIVLILCEIFDKSASFLIGESLALNLAK